MSEQTAIKELLQSAQTLATPIHAIIRRQYGEDAYDWDLVTIMMEAQDDWQVEMAPAAANRWAAIQTIMTTDAFFTRLDAFLAICNTLSTGEPYFTLFDPVTTEEAAWAIAEVSLNRDLLPFSYAIRQYLRMTLQQDGYSEHDVPDIFDAVLEPTDDQRSVRTELRAIKDSPNRTNVENYIDDQLRDMASQFDKVPSLSTIDDMLAAQTSETLVEML